MNSHAVGFYVATVFALLVATVSRRGLAATPVAYSGSLCRGTDTDYEGHVSRSSGHLSATANVHVVCPIIKTTSGPGIWDGDEISNVTVSFASSSVATCWLTIYSANQFGDQGQNVPTNVMEQSFGSVSSSTISLSSETVSYWNGYEDHHTWYYPELYCEIDSGGTLTSYSVTEEGTVQDYDRIAPESNCANATGGDHYNYVEPGAPGGNDWGGYVAAAGSESGFSMVCPVLAGGGSAIEIAVGPTISPPTMAGNLMGCESTDTSTWQYADYDSGYQFPPQVLTYSQTTPSELICQMQNLPPTGGDAKVFSYRTAADTSDFTLQ